MYSKVSEVYGEYALSHATIYRWYNAFEVGQESGEMQGGLGAPRSSITDVAINIAGTILSTNPHLTVKNIAHMLGIYVGSVAVLMATSVIKEC